MAHSSLHDHHVDAAGGVGLGHRPQVTRVLGVGLEADRADLSEVPRLWLSKIFFIEREDLGKGEVVGLVQLSDLQSTVGPKVDKDMKTPVQRIQFSIFLFRSFILLDIIILAFQFI